MKIYVFCSAAHLNDECADIMDVQVFTEESAAKNYLDKTIAELTSEEGGWTSFSNRPNHFQLTDGDEEYVAYVTEREV